MIEPLIRIADRPIGAEHPAFMIAEIGINHEGNVETARELVRHSAEAGADAVKFQFVFADTLYPPALWGSEHHRLFEGCQLTTEQCIALAEDARQLGVIPFASFNDRQGVDIAEQMGAPMHKIASTQMTNEPLVRYAASKGKPLIVSTGMANLGEIEMCLTAARAAGATDLVLLHCVSNYPTRPEHVNLRAMQTLKGAFGLPVGFSDHSDGLLASTLAAAMGACVIERHVSLDRSRPGFDHRVSLEPAELARLVERVRDVHSMRGDGDVSARSSEAPLRGDYRMSLGAACDIDAGVIIDPEMLIGMRPGTGLPPSFWSRLAGRPARRGMKRGDLFDYSDLPEAGTSSSAG